MDRSDLIICGAGIAGIAAAYYLSARYGRSNITLVDRDLPMSYTTSKSGENYRDYWPQACLAAFASRSIELMEEIDSLSGGVGMKPFGYDFVSMEEDHDIFPVPGPGDAGHTHALEIIDQPGDIGRRFPYLSGSIRKVTRIRNAGAVDVHALGSQMLTAARKAGVRVETAQVTRVSRPGSTFMLETSTGGMLESRELLLTAGPMNPGLAAQLDVKLEMKSFLQRKFVLPDPNRIIPRDMPFTIFADAQYLQWNDEERELIRNDPEYRHLLDEFPPGLHIKPEAGSGIKLGWAYNREATMPSWEPADDFDFPNIVLRGASRFIPGLKAYVENPPTPVVQFSGYYTRTPENWPVIGPLGRHPGLYTIAALSGYGTMTACAAGELAAQWMMEEPLPGYARHFHPDRYNDSEIMVEIKSAGSDGQL